MSPKIHKDPRYPPGRPIVCGSGGPTGKILQFVDHFIGPLVPLSKSHFRDSTHLINILNVLSVKPGNLLCILRVTNLYINIPYNEGIQAIKEMLAIHRSPHDLPHSSNILEVLTVVLTNNYFEFNGMYHHQVSGTAMYAKLAP